jgi:type VI secretion system protein ImpE
LIARLSTAHGRTWEHIAENNIMNAHELFQMGRLQQAVDAQSDVVKRSPTDVNHRGFLSELLLFTGDFERADTHLELMTKQEPKTAVGVTLLRQLVRAERARQQFFSEGRVPEVIDEPSPCIRLHIEASVLIRDGKLDEAVKVLAEAEARRPRISGTCDGRPFDDFRDGDDLTSCFLEVLTSTGKYYWIPLERVALLEFHAAKRPWQLLWRPAHMLVANGPDGEVYLPTLYVNTADESDDQLRLGRATDWRGGNGTPVRGRGRRTFLVGDEPRDILDIGTVAVTGPGGTG